MNRSKKGGGVGIWTALSFERHIRKDLMTADRKFFESLWVESDSSSMQKNFG